MNRYQFTHDGVVIVEGGEGVYVDSPQNFEVDSGFPVIGAPGLMLIVGGIECAIDADGNQRASGLSPADSARCVQFTETVAALLAAQGARKAAAMGADEKRRLEYVKRGATDAALTVALWEKLVEGKPEAADALQAVRVAVKAEIPK